jgi:hypothetical protein
MGGFAPIPLDPLPQVEKPTAQDVQANPAQAQKAQGGGQEVSGWTGKGGQSLNLVTNFLSGWMAGKYMNEQKKQKAAIDEVGHYQTDYQNSMMVYQNMVNNPDAKPEEKEQARQGVLKNWKELHAVQMKYLIPGSGEGAPKKGGVKNKLKGALGAEDPHLFAAGAIKLADQIDPTKAISADPKRQKEEFEFNEEKEDAKLKHEYRVLAIEADKGPLSPEKQKRFERLENEVHGSETADRNKILKIQRQEMEQEQHDMGIIRDKLSRGGRASLNEREIALAEKNGELQKAKDITTPAEAYLQDVGPGKRFATAGQAADAWVKKEIQMRVAERPLRQPSMWEEMTNFGKASLNEQHTKDDADPTKPHKYRITIGDKTQERELTDEQVAAAQKRDQGLKATKIPSTITPGELADWVTERMKPTPGQREDAKPNLEDKDAMKARDEKRKADLAASKPLTPAQGSQLLSPIVADVIDDNAEKHPGWKDFTMSRPIPGGDSIAIKPYESGQGSSWNPWKKSEKELQKDYKDFQHAVGVEMIRNGQGHRIKELLPGYFGDSTSSEQEYTPEPMEAPPV